MILYWSFINFTIFVCLVGLGCISILVFMRELLNKKNYVIQLTGTSAENLQEIQSQCQQLLNKEKGDQSAGSKSKFQLMELSKITIYEIKKFIKSINYMKYQVNNILVNYHYQFNLMKDDNKYPKIVLQKSGMLFLLFFNLFCSFNLKVSYYKYFKKKKMEFGIEETLLIGLISFIVTMLINKYLVNLSNSHSYYVLFNKLKYKQTQIEKNKKEIHDNLVYDRKKFKQFFKPIKLLVDQQEKEEEANKAEQKQDGVEILFMKIDSLDDFVLDDEDTEMVEKLEQQDQYLGIYYFLLLIISMMIYTIFVQFHNLFQEVPSNHFLIINLLFAIVADYVYRLVACILIFTGLFIHSKYKKVNFGQEISRIQIYEVFEEHVKLGINCLDENYESEKGEEELEEIFSKYSFVTVDSVEKQQKEFPSLQKNEKVTDDEHWFFKAVKKIRKDVNNGLEQTHLPEHQYNHKHRNTLDKQQAQQIQKAQQNTQKAHQDQIDHYLQQRDKIKRKNEIQYQFIDLEQNLNQNDQQQIEKDKNIQQLKRNEFLEIEQLRNQYNNTQFINPDYKHDQSDNRGEIQQFESKQKNINNQTQYQ